jgi:hypothetical protein
VVTRGFSNIPLGLSANLKIIPSRKASKVVRGGLAVAVKIVVVARGALEAARAKPYLCS